MRFVKRILIGFGVATALAIAAPTAASAAAPSSVVFDDDWGPYFSAGHKAEASGHVTVEKEKYKKGHWVKKPVWVKKCSKHKGHIHCKKKKEFKKVWVWEWDWKYHFKVKGTLENHKWWGDWKYRCAWVTFKIRHFDGSVDFESFNNCKKWDKKFWFSGKDVKRIEVQVSRGNVSSPKGYFGGWKTIYAAVPAP